MLCVHPHRGFIRLSENAFLLSSDFKSECIEEIAVGFPICDYGRTRTCDPLVISLLKYSCCRFPSSL